MRLVTYNILNPFHAVKWRTDEGLDVSGEDNWRDHRALRVISNLQASHFDVACIQELSESTFNDLSSVFEIATFHKHFTEDAPQGEHGTAILYNPAKMEMIASGGYRTERTMYRYAAWADLRDLESGRVLRAISVHLKGYNPYEEEIPIKRAAQVNGDTELSYYLDIALDDLDGVDGVTVMGDFNEDAQEMKVRGETSRQAQLIKRGFIWDEVEDVTESRSSRKIDWVFYLDTATPKLTTLNHVEVVQDRAASDHAISASLIVDLS